MAGMTSAKIVSSMLEYTPDANVTASRSCSTDNAAARFWHRCRKILEACVISQPQQKFLWALTAGGPVVRCFPRPVVRDRKSVV